MSAVAELTPHEYACTLAEARLGRSLTLAERNIDLVGIDRTLEAAKQRLAMLVDQEKRRAMRRHFRGHRRTHMELTPQMAKLVESLYLAGQRFAREEIHRMTGVSFAQMREYATDGPGYAKTLTLLGAQLNEFQTKVSQTALEVDLSAEAGGKVIARALRIPGALNVASNVVSTGLLSGIGDVYDQAAGLFATFIYSAVMDSGTCDVCAPLDGTVFDSWEAIQAVLPDGGPNPDCEGGPRCRCRAVPGDEALAPVGPTPSPETTDTLETLNPTGGLLVPYGPAERAAARLGPNLTTLDKTMNVAPDTQVTIYRGAPLSQREIAAGDFVTTNEQLAKDYAGDGHVISMRVPASHVLDDITEPLGEEYIYRPPALPPQVAEDLRRARLEPGVVDEATPAEIAGIPSDEGEALLAPDAQKTADALDHLFAPMSYDDAEREIYAWYRAPSDFATFEGQLRKGRTTGFLNHVDSMLRPYGREGGEINLGYAPSAEMRRMGIPFTRKTVTGFNPDMQMVTESGMQIPLKPLVEKLDAMVVKSPALTEDTTFYRGTQTLNRIFGADGPTVGESYVERGYMSVSADPTVAEMFAQGMSGQIPGEGGTAFIELRVPKGAHGIWARASGEDQIHEFTLPRHSMMVVDAVDHIVLPPTGYVRGGEQLRIRAHIELPKADPADIGITPFREGIDNPVDFYNSDRFLRFEKDVRESADYYGVAVDAEKQVTGVWEGSTEPSVSLHVHDSVDGVRAYSANLGKAYGQDGVLVFNDQSFESAMLTFDYGPSRETIIDAMKEVGISGGRFTADGRLQVIGEGAEFVKQASALSERLGVKYRAETGHFALIEKDGYDQALRVFDGKGATAGPELPLGTSSGGQSGLATARGEGEARATVTTARAAQRAGKLATDDVEAAAEALAAGRDVELLRPNEISTLLDDLAGIAKDAEARGERAPVYDLGRVSVRGTNLFTKDSLGVKRVEMPQLKGVPLPGSKADALARDKRGEVDLAGRFYAELRAKGIKVSEQDVPVATMKATQMELDGSKVAGIMEFLKGGGKIEGRIPISRDRYIVDGHHRWASEIGLDYAGGTDAGLTLPVEVIDQPITEILKEANDFAREWGIPQAAIDAPMPNVAATEHAITRARETLAPILTRESEALTPAELDNSLIHAAAIELRSAEQGLIEGEEEHLIAARIQERANQVNEAKDKLDKLREIGIGPPAQENQQPPAGSVPEILATVPGIKLVAIETGDVIQIASADVISYGDNVRALGFGTSPGAILKDALLRLLGYADRADKLIAVTPIDAAGLSAAELRAWFLDHGFRSNSGIYGIPNLSQELIRPPGA